MPCQLDTTRLFIQTVSNVVRSLAYFVKVFVARLNSYSITFHVSHWDRAAKPARTPSTYYNKAICFVGGRRKSSRKSKKIGPILI